MSIKNHNQRIIFGLKVKKLRQDRQLSFSNLSKKCGLSISYLNEIEKGKKYPKEDKIKALAEALSVSYEQLTSEELSRGLEPLKDLLHSNFLKELPLDLFGIDLAKVAELIANAPAKVGAFISTLLELSRSYALREENFYFGALRSYLELHHNYFEDLEKAVDEFTVNCGVPPIRPVPVGVLKDLLEKRYNYVVEENGLDAFPKLQKLRSVYIPKSKRLLLNSKLTDSQKTFQFGKELAFQYLELKERAFTSSLLRGRVFDEVLNHSKAIYFSVALHIPQQSIIDDMTAFFQMEKWNGEAFLAIMEKYQATPEMFYHRLTNILPKFFKLPQLFFLRFLQTPEIGRFEIDKELHLNRKHHPHGNALLEHYCRRWVSISLLEELRRQLNGRKEEKFIVGVQRSQYMGTDDEYLCLTIARSAYPAPDRNVSVTLGLLINKNLDKQIRFLDDPAIPFRMVNKTCERCPLSDCLERAAAPKIVEKRDSYRQIQEQLKVLMEEEGTGR